MIYAALLRNRKITGQFLRPDSDVETTDWTSTPLWQKVDEVNPDDATTFVTSSSVSGTTGVFNFTVGLTNPSRPVITAQGHQIRVRARLVHDLGTGSTGSLTITLLETATTIASQFGFSLTTSWSTYQLNLNDTQKGNINNYNNLRIQITADIDASGLNEAHVDCTWAELHILDYFN